MRSVLNEREIGALREALDDEFKAFATYGQVLADFGPVRPFINIREAEARHIAALERVFERYALSVPTGNPWIGKSARYASVAEACSAGVQAEIANAALYDRLLESTSRPDILRVYRALQEASQQQPPSATSVTRCLPPAARLQRRSSSWSSWPFQRSIWF